MNHYNLAKEKGEVEFREKFPKLLYEGTDVGGYDAKPYVLSFLTLHSEEIRRAVMKDVWDMIASIEEGISPKLANEIHDAIFPSDTNNK